MAQNLESIVQLADMMERLRDPNSGCPWDLAQTHQSLRKYVLEEAYEVADAIDGGSDDDLKSELGDLLLQVVFHGEIARAEGRFDLNDIAQSICKKMISRHPHVFGENASRSVEEQNREWEIVKSAERKAFGHVSALDGVARALPALSRAHKLQKRAARVGFGWDDSKLVRAKIFEELDELEGASPSQQQDEFGDVLFALVNYGRHLGLDPEEALERTNEKFLRRFGFIESELAKQNLTPLSSTLEQMEELWQKAKTLEPKP